MIHLHVVIRYVQDGDHFEESRWFDPFTVFATFFDIHLHTTCIIHNLKASHLVFFVIKPQQVLVHCFCCTYEKQSCLIWQCSIPTLGTQMWQSSNKNWNLISRSSNLFQSMRISISSDAFSAPESVSSNNLSVTQSVLLMYLGCFD